MKTKKFTVTAAGAWAWDGPVSVIYYEQGADAGGQTAYIRLRSPDGNAVDAEMKPGRQITLSTPIAGVVIESLTGNAISGKISLGLGDIKDSSLLGTVEVIDGGKNRSLAGATYVGVASVGAAAGTSPHVQLWNPVASGRNVFLAQIQASANAISAYISVRRAVAALNNLQGQGVAKRLDSAAQGNSSAELRYAGPATTIAGTSLAVLGLPSNPGASTFKYTEPILLTPGAGVTLVAVNAQGGDLAGTFEWTEEAQ